MSAAESSGKGPKQYLVIWDFDHSMANENSDYFVSQQVLTKRRFDELYSFKHRAPTPTDRRDFRELSFCEFQDSITFRYLFNECGLSRKEFIRIIGDLPWFDENLTIVRTLGEATKQANERLSGLVSDIEKSKDLSSPIVRQAIVSNANTKLTSAILDARGLDNEMFASINTNQGFWQNSLDSAHLSDFEPDSKTLLSDANFEELSGGDLKSLLKPLQKDSEIEDSLRTDEEGGLFRLRVRSWNAQRGLHIDCDICRNRDMCKGYIVEQAVMPPLGLEDRSKYDITLIYVGDGGNDLCPILRFEKGDYAFIRRGMTLDGLTQEDDPLSHLPKIKANVRKWKDGRELLTHFQAAIPHLDFSASDATSSKL